MSEEGDQGVSKPISRRKFLEKGGKLLGLAAATQTLARLGMIPETSVATEKESTSSVVVMDFFQEEKETDILIRKSFYPGFSEKEALEGMGVKDDTTEKGLLGGTPESDEDVKLLALKFLSVVYFDHGGGVVSSGQQTERFITGEQKDVTDRVSIVKAFEIKEITYDELGNPVVHFSINKDVVSKLVDASSEPVVNMSFELGSNSVTFNYYAMPKAELPIMQKKAFIRDSEGNEPTQREAEYFDSAGNSISKQEYERLLKEYYDREPVLLPSAERRASYVDGYAGEHTAENVKLMAEVAREHPDRIFVVAGGNPTGLYDVPDIREIRKQLEEEDLWPENIIVVGYEADTQADEDDVWSIYRGPSSGGADIYVSAADLEEFGFDQASSYATPVVSKIVSLAIRRGIKKPEKIKEFLRENSDIKDDSSYGNEEGRYYLLNLDKVKDFFDKDKQVGEMY